MTIIVDPKTFSTRPARAIEEAVRAARARDGGAWLVRALALRTRHAPDILWSHSRSRVAGRVLDACARVAEQTRRESGLPGAVVRPPQNPVSRRRVPNQQDRRTVSLQTAAAAERRAGAHGGHAVKRGSVRTLS